MDQYFLSKLERIVDENLNNEQFGVEMLAREVSLSRYQIHRKLHSLTGQSISRFIREVRLKRALLLLKEGNSSASDIAYQVGFGSATYFNKCFHEYYGSTPGEIRRIEPVASNNESSQQVDHSGIASNRKNINPYLQAGLWFELKKDQVFQAGLAYLLSSWLLLQIIDIPSRLQLIPTWIYMTVLILLLVGFPIILYLAWSDKKKHKSVVDIKPDYKVQETVTARIPHFTGKLFNISIFTIIVFTYFIPKEVVNYPYPVNKESEIRVHDSGKSIAVLPFENHSNNPDNQHFANGIMDAVINQLSTIHDLRISSSGSSKQFQDSGKSINEIAKELDVDYVLQSSVQQYDEIIRITTRIIDVEKDDYIWSKEYTEPLTDMLNIMTAIATDIVTELDLTITPREEILLARKPTVDFSAYDLYMKGRMYYGNYLSLFNKDDLLAAEKCYSGAISIDSTFALAYVGLGEISEEKRERWETLSIYEDE